jgi:hypothetical protein
MANVIEMSESNPTYTQPIPVKAGVTIQGGSFFAVDSSGRAVPANDATAIRIAGRAPTEYANTAAGAADGDLSITAERGRAYTVTNSGTDPVAAADILSIVYLEDVNVIRKSRTSLNQPVAGVLLGFDGVYPVIEIVSGIRGLSVGFHSAVGTTLTAGQSGSLITNIGAAGAVVHVLPVAVPGLEFTFAVKVAQHLRADPNGNETIELPSTGVQGAAGKYLGINTIGSFVHLRCLVAGAWSVVSSAGAWAAEP